MASSFSIPSFILVLVLDVAMAAAADTTNSHIMDVSSYIREAKPNQALVKLAGANQTTSILVSSDGSYAWQFFTHNSTQLHNRLLVVSYTFYSSTVVWIANRDHTVSPSAALYYDTQAGSLLLQEPADSAGNATIAWKCAADAGGGPIRTILMNNTGNLLMLSTTRANVSAPTSMHDSTILWQSFDHPADVIVTGQRLRTNRTVTASVSNDDWSSGRYILKVEPGGVVLYATFDAQQAMVPYLLFNYVFTDTSYKTSLHSACNHTESVYNGSFGVTLQQEEGFMTPQCIAENNHEDNFIHDLIFKPRIGGNGFRFVRLMPNGDINTFLLSGDSYAVQEDTLFSLGFLMTHCWLPSYCGINSLCNPGKEDRCDCPVQFTAIDATDTTKGCRLQTPLDCTALQQHEFVHVPNADYYANNYVEPHATVGNADECAELCRPNCSCTAAFYNKWTGACHVYYQVQTMYNGSMSNPNVTALLRVGPKAQNNHSLLTKETTGVVVFSIILLGLVVAWTIKRLQRRRHVEIDTDTEEEAFLESLPGLPPRFTYKELEQATEGFSKPLGSGGSGAVYEGNVCFKAGARPDIVMKVAVKELNISNESIIAASSKTQFRAEVATLGSLNHVNLVQLRGFCAEGVHRLLIYEFMENSSLDRWIFAKSEWDFVLPWDVRYSIAMGTARGLAFLHEESREKVVHLDVKPQNILLDATMRAKLADFGLSKLMQRGQSRTVTAMRGTPGYIAPEWLMETAITPKCDVFSYGVVLLELVGGRKNLKLGGDGEDWYLAAWAVKQAERGNLAQVVDYRLRRTESMAEKTESAGISKMKRLLNIAFWCIQEDPNSRPSMTDVLLMLEEHSDVPEPPLHTTYILRQLSRSTEDKNDKSAGTSSTSCSAAAASELVISSLQPR